MIKKEMSLEAYAHLRSQAKERIKTWSHYEVNEHTDLHQVIHELKIHLAEQEIMNEELSLAIKREHDEEKPSVEPLVDKSRSKMKMYDGSLSRETAED
jgi:hypothetical protein